MFRSSSLLLFKIDKKNDKSWKYETGNIVIYVN